MPRHPAGGGEPRGCAAADEDRSVGGSDLHPLRLSDSSNTAVCQDQRRDLHQRRGHLPSRHRRARIRPPLRDGQRSPGRASTGRPPCLFLSPRGDLRRTVMHRFSTHTRIYINLSFPELAAKHAALPCDGVGLMRAEFLALSVGVHPRKLIAEGGEEGFVRFFAEGLSRVAEAFTPRPVIYRTLDLKSNEYAGLQGGSDYESREENPMLGLRGCSRYLSDPESFRLELRAVKCLRDAGLRNIKVMLPFVRFPRKWCVAINGSWKKAWWAKASSCG